MGLTTDQQSQLNSGTWYVLVATQTIPLGELVGLIVLTTQCKYTQVSLCPSCFQCSICLMVEVVWGPSQCVRAVWGRASNLFLSLSVCLSAIMFVNLFIPLFIERFIPCHFVNPLHTRSSHRSSGARLREPNWRRSFGQAHC